MGKRRLCLLRRGVDCIADLSATRTYIKSRSLKELFHTPSVRHWVRQGMIGNFGGHCGRRPQSNLLRELSFAVYQFGCKRSAECVSRHGGLFVRRWEGGHVKCPEWFGIDSNIPHLLERRASQRRMPTVVERRHRRQRIADPEAYSGRVPRDVQRGSRSEKELDRKSPVSG